MHEKLPYIVNSLVRLHAIHADYFSLVYVNQTS